MMRRDENRAELATAAGNFAREPSPEALARLHALSTQEKAEELAEEEPAASALYGPDEGAC